MAVRVVGPDGRQWDLPDESKIQDAIQSGYRPLAEGEESTLGEDIKGGLTEAREQLVTGAEGVLRGATAGLSDVALTKLYSAGAKSPDEQARAQFNREEMARRKEENPVAATIGDVLGMLVSPVSKLGPAVKGAIGAETALGRIGAGVAGGAAEGSLFGAGNTLSETALGDTQLTAEKLIAGAGLGALLGGAGGGIGTAIDEAVSYAVPRLARMVGTRGLDDIAEDAAVKATRSQQGVLNKMEPEQVKAAGRVLLDRGHVKGSPEEMLKSLQDDISAIGAKKGSYLDAADNGVITPDWAAARGAIDDFAAKISPLEREAIAGPLTKARNALDEISSLDNFRSEPAWKAFDKFKQNLQAMAKFSRGAAEDDLALGLRRQLAGVAREELDRQLVPALGAEGQNFLAAKKLYGSLKDAERLATSGAGRAKPSGLGFGMYDLLAGGAGGAALHHPAGLALAVANKFMREQGPALIAKAADAISKSPTLKLMAASFAQKAPQVATNFGEYGPVLAQALGKSPEYGLATHIVLAQTNPAYATKAAQAGFLAETGAEEGAATAKAQGLVGVAAALKDTDEAITKGVDKVFKASARARGPDVTSRQDFGAKRMRRGGVEAHEQRMKEAADLASNPEALVDRVTKNIGDLAHAAPGVTAAATNVAHRAVTYLAAQIQKPVKPGPLAPDWHFPKADLFAFSKKLETVEEPLSVLEHAAAGTLTKPQVEALQTVYPTVFAQIRDVATAKLTGSPRGVPYKARLMLSLLTGVDPDGTLGATSTNQQALQALAEQQQSQPPPQADSGKLKGSALAMATPDQRRELRRDSET